MKLDSVEVKERKKLFADEALKTHVLMSLLLKRLIIRLIIVAMQKKN
jgi:hypothetical protein